MNRKKAQIKRTTKLQLEPSDEFKEGGQHYPIVKSSRSKAVQDNQCLEKVLKAYTNV